ncbi:hypothetical protein H312_02522, partial [Anncaliia algerae PRA339]
MKQKTLFSFIKDNKIALDSIEVREFTGNFVYESTYESDQKLLSLLYHSPDIKISKLISDKENDSSKKRYYVDNTLCYECGQVGHTERRCPRNLEPFCVLCTGAHYKVNCIMKVCNRCNTLGHIARDCKEEGDRKRFLQCRKCRYEHSESDCPRWRRYIFKENSYVKPLKYRACTNCASDNHFTDDCRSRKSKFSIFNSDYKSVSNFFQ